MISIFRTALSTTVLLLIVTSLFAQNTRTATITASEPKAASIDSVVDDLQKIVVLCAVEHDSREFEDL